MIDTDDSDGHEPGQPGAGGHSSSESTEVPSARTSVASTSRVAEAHCTACGASRIRDDLFCEVCGHPLADDAVDEEAIADRAVWIAVVAVDREHYDRGEWRGIDFPDDASERHITLSGSELRIGRGGVPAAELEIELDDPAASRAHATLVLQPDGTYAIVDKGSTNGTTLNGDVRPVPPNLPIPVGDGDRIHVGAWTTIVLVRGEPEHPG